MTSLQRLPESSFVPFVAQAVDAPQVLYRDSNVTRSDASVIENFAYAVPADFDTREGFGSVSRVFLADRYGGSGVSRHGGSGRCGSFGGVQIKGIGRTPLIALDSDKTFFWHAHGGMAVSDGLQEALWSRVFDYALPYGACRTLALIATHTETWFEYEIGRKDRAPRVLVVREAVIRPAHFERAPYFSLNRHAKPSDDVERVRAAIIRLPDVLPLSEAATSQALGPWGRLEAGLAEMLRRFALQIATAQSKRLAHGAIQSCNLCVDGRYIDFGTPAQLPHYRNTRSYKLPPNLPSFWEEQWEPIRVLESLCFHIGKYFPGDRGGRKQFNVKRIADRYLSTYYAYLGEAFLRLCGFPHHLVTKYQGDGRVAALSAQLIAMARKDPKIVLSGQEDLRCLGSNELGDRLFRVALSQLEVGETMEGSAAANCDEIDAAWSQVYLAAADVFYDGARQEGISHWAMVRLGVLHIAKQRMYLPALSRSGMRSTHISLMDRFGSRSIGARDIDDYLRDLSGMAEVMVSPLSGYRILLWRKHNVTLFFDAILDGWVVEGTEKSDKAYSLNDTRVPLLHEALSFLGLSTLRQLLCRKGD